MKVVLAIAVLVLAAGCGADDGEPATGRGETLTVAQALASGADGPLRVRGTLISNARAVRLCSAILESHPPQCGQPSLRVRGLDLVGVSNMEQAKGVGWTRREVTLVGEVEHGELTVSG